MAEGQDTAALKMKEELSHLSAILNGKQEAFRQKLITPNNADRTLPIDCIIKTQSEKCVDVSTGPSERLNEMVEDLFGGNFLKGMKGLILGAIESVLGSASAGEKEKVGYSIMYLHSAVVRIDYMVYAYRFRSDGLTNALQNGMCFCATISTVKLFRVNSEAIALISGLTAEKSMSFFKKQRRKCREFVFNIKDNPKFYDVPVCVGYIRGYFGADLTDEQQTTLEGFLNVDPNASPNDKEVTQVNANQMLSARAAEASVETTDESDILAQQKQLLDNMAEIYTKIAEVKRSSVKSIKEADGTML